MAEILKPEILKPMPSSHFSLVYIQAVGGCHIVHDIGPKRICRGHIIYGGDLLPTHCTEYRAGERPLKKAKKGRA